MPEPDRDTYWRIDGRPEEIDNLPLDGHPGPEPTRSYGETYTLTCRLSDRSDSATGAWPAHVERYKRLLLYGSHAGQYSTHTLLSGRVSYTETHTGHSLLIAVRPPAGSETGRGGYYLVSSLTDATTLPDRVAIIEMDVLYLADVADYDSLADVAALLEADGI